MISAFPEIFSIERPQTYQNNINRMYKTSSDKRGQAMAYMIIRKHFTEHVFFYPYFYRPKNKKCKQPEGERRIISKLGKRTQSKQHCKL